MSESREKASSFSCIFRQIENGFFARPNTSPVTPCFSITVSISSVIFGITSPDSFCSVKNRRMIELRASGLSTRKARSSNSSRIQCIPIRPASGAKMSMVSRAFLACFSCGICRIVRILCRRSASFTKITRMSLDMAIKSLRKFSACLLSRFDSSRLVSLVTPSTNSATSLPKRSTISEYVPLVSSIVSCRSAVAIVASSNRCSVRIAATATGCVK